jgi:hypothetical protein
MDERCGVLPQSLSLPSGEDEPKVKVFQGTIRNQTPRLLRQSKSKVQKVITPQINHFGGRNVTIAMAIISVKVKVR